MQLSERLAKVESDLAHVERKLDAHVLECQAIRLRIEAELKHLNTAMARVSLLGIIAIAVVGPFVSFLLQKLFGN